MTTAVERTAEGKFISSGNIAGRPKSAKNQITTLKQDLEIAIRQGVKQGHIQAIVDSMVKLAIEGNVGAGKLILDKVLSNAKVEEDMERSDSSILIRVQNVTIGAPEDNSIIDVTPIEETDMSTGASAEKQNGPPSGGASGAAGVPNAPRREPGEVVGESNGSKESDGSGGK